MNRGAINKGMHGIEAKAIDVKVAHPHQCVICKEAAYFMRVLFFKIDSSAPRCVVRLRDVWPEFSRVVAYRPEVVIDNVEQHRQATLMSGVDEAFERIRAAIRLIYGIERDAIVSPAMIARKRRDRQQLDVRDAEFGQVVEMRDGSIERAFWREGTHMQFVDD